MKYKLWFALGWIVVSASLALGVYLITEQLGVRFHHDFRNPLPGKLRPYGPQAGLYVKKEADGLRITLPKDRKNHEAVGVALTLPVEGDFEITATVEILQADQPSPDSFGVGIFMTADETVRMGRLDRAKGIKVMSWDQWVDKLVENELKKTWVNGNVECDANVVQLRMKRTGSTIAYMWAEEKADEFQLIHEEKYKDTDIKEIRVMAETGKEPLALDVRFLNLRVTGDPGPAPLYWWLGLGVVVVAGLGLGLYFVPMTKPQPAKAKGKTAETQATDASAVDTSPAEESLAVTCPGCKKHLRVSAKVTGKKIKCPACEAVISV